MRKHTLVKKIWIMENSETGEVLVDTVNTTKFRCQLDGGCLYENWKPVKAKIVRLK